MPHFDKPDKLTVSGMHRGAQRTLYDTRRDTEIPAQGLRLVVIRPADLDADGRGRLRRNQDTDLAALRRILARDSNEDRVCEVFRSWLLTEGWTLVDPADRWTDVEAVRDDERLICEAPRGAPARRGSTPISRAPRLTSERLMRPGAGPAVTRRAARRTATGPSDSDGAGRVSG